MDDTAAVATFNAATRHKVERLDRHFFDGPSTYIFNLYPREFPFYASYGTRIVPACPEDEDYSEPLVIPYMVSDFVQKQGDDGGLLEKAIPGVAVVAEILNMLGDTINPISAWGVFASKTETPTKAEIKAARERLITTLQNVVAQGNSYYNGAPEDRKNLCEKHLMAARYLNLSPVWAMPEAVMDRCESCNVPVVAGVAFCSNGCIVDEAKARKAKPWLFSGQPVAA